MSAPAKSILDGAEVVQLDPNEIDTSGRIGFYHEDKAVAFGRLIYKDGQRDAVKVSKSKSRDFKWRLHVGLHRTMGCKLEGIPVRALIVSGTSDQLRDLEASENLHHRRLGPIERAKFVFELARAARERIAREHGDISQQQLAIKARWDRVKHGEELAEGALRDETEDTVDKMSTVYGWKASVAEALELGPREVQRSLSLYHLLIEPFPDLAEALSKHPVVGENGSQLKTLAAVKSEDRRRAVIEALLADHEIGVEDAKIAAGLPRLEAQATPVAHQKFYNQIISGWDRLGNPEKTRFLPKLAAMLTEGQKRELRDRLNEELGDA